MNAPFDAPRELAEHLLAVDLGVLAELDDDEAALELVQMYDEETKGVLEQLESFTKVTAEAGERTAPAWSSIWASLHKLKGSSLSIGLTGVSECIESLRTADHSDLHEWYPQVFELLKYAVDTSMTKVMAKLG